MWKLKHRELKSLVECVLEHEPPGTTSSVIFNVPWLMLSGWKPMAGYLSLVESNQTPRDLHA